MSEPANFRDVLISHTPLLYRIAASYEADPALQEDLVQEIALALWRALPGFKGDSSLKTYIARIAQNRCISHVARESTRKSREPLGVELESSLPGPEDGVNQQKEREVLARALRTLPLSLRQVAVLALEGMKPAEIADVLQISANNASVRLNRAKESLTAAMEKLV